MTNPPTTHAPVAGHESAAESHIDAALLRALLRYKRRLYTVLACAEREIEIDSPGWDSLGLEVDAIREIKAGLA